MLEMRLVLRPIASMPDSHGLRPTCRFFYAKVTPSTTSQPLAAQAPASRRRGVFDVLPSLAGQGTPSACWNDVLLQWQPSIEVDALAHDVTRVVVVAPHPDDEIIGSGALLSALSRRGIPIVLIAVTDGEASHPHSSHWTPQSLMRIRARERRRGLGVLLQKPVTLCRDHVTSGVESVFI
jgi:hypothetical protein